jgi:uncharacterized membrane protein
MMNKTTRMLILAGIILASSAFASLLIQIFTTKKSWLAFVGWMIFFASSQAPALLVSRSSERACSGWLNRLRNRQ